MRFNQYFASDQILLLKSEDLFSEPKACLGDNHGISRLNHIHCPQLTPVYHGEGESRGVDPSFKERLRKKLDPTYQWMEAVF